MGLQFMHSRNPLVIHQDLKPLNIMVSIYILCNSICFNYSVYIPKVTHDLSQTYICDLGVAKIKHQATPEMFGATHQSTAVDVYSLGCLYIELFGGKWVWEGMTDGMQIMQKVCGSYNNPPKMPEVDHLDPIYGNIC